MTEAEALCRGFLENAAARQSVVASVAPEEPSADYLAGFSAGFDSGQVAALALAVGVMTGESPTALIQDARGAGGGRRHLPVRAAPRGGFMSAHRRGAEERSSERAFVGAPSKKADR